MNTEIKLDGQNLRDEYPYIPSEPSDFETSIDVVLQTIKQTLLLKRKRYGKGNIQKFGLFGILVRSSDKVERLINLEKTNSNPEDESVYDSWLDLAGYAVLALIFISGWFDKD